jgi:integrase/recombinase XerD
MMPLTPFREDIMRPLRHRMIQDLQLRGYADRTIEAYTRAVAQLAEFYHSSPDTLTEEHLREYLLHLTTVQKVARGTHTIALCGIDAYWARLRVLAPARPRSSAPHR